MELALPSPMVLLVVVVAIAAVGLALFVVLLAAVVFVILRRRGGPAPVREDVLRDLGYAPVEPGTWSRRFSGTAIVFTDKEGWRWTLRLPRYNTLALGIEERASGRIPEGRVFDTGEPGFDQRFVVASALAAQAVALVTNRAVSKALLALPYVSLELHGDELVLADPELRSLAAASARPNTAAAVEAEHAVHVAIGVLVNAVFDSLYSRQTGTIMPEHR